jgi:serine/threonine protein kinase
MNPATEPLPPEANRSDLTVGTPPPPPDDLRLVRALEEYFDELESGRRPDRERFLARYPEVAAALAECLDGLHFVHAAASQLYPAGSTAKPSDELGPATALGDYLLIREVGRGGMGVVYEAEQLSLGRRVALKVLPFAATLDPRQLQRFKNEAQAAAHLHHQNIVPVYAVGCERGVHYYAMQYIDGQSLAAIIQEQRRRMGLERPVQDAAINAPTPRPGSRAWGRVATADTNHSLLSTSGSVQAREYFRAVARVGVQAAEALDYAHQCGVVHRDIKPGNLLFDVRGNLWVADFGLARFEGSDALTATGDLLGTLRYMSPEQALTRRGPLDQRTDVYSLGVTLYELLTLQPAFHGPDRQELLRQIAHEEPCPPRRLNRGVPAELETIVLKAMAKVPAERYASARELADDLRRFLEDQPIRARRPTVVERGRKWARRHQALVTAAAVVGVLALGMLSVSTAFMVRARNRALESEQRAQRAVDTMYTQVAERWLARAPHLEPLQREFLLEALGYYQEFAGAPGSDPRQRQEKGRAYRRVGDIQQRLGRFEEARAAYDRAVTTLDGLVSEFPATASYERDLALARNNLGNVLRDMGRLALAEQAYRGAGRAFEKSQEHGLPGRAEYAACSSNLGIVLSALDRNEEAESAYRRGVYVLERADRAALAAPEYRHDLAGSYNNLANLLASTDKTAEAEQLYRQAVALWDGLLAEAPAEPVYRQSAAVSLAGLGLVLAAERRFDSAEQMCRAALSRQGELAEDFPGVPAYRQQWAATYQALGNVLAAASRPAEAERAYKKALALQERLVGDFPSAPAYQRELAVTYHAAAHFFHDAGRHREASENCERALRLRDKLVVAFPDTPAYRRELADSRRLAETLAGSSRAARPSGGMADFERLWECLAALVHDCCGSDGGPAMIHADARRQTREGAP